MYNKVLVPLDGSPVAECVITHVEALAGAFGGEVILITIVEPVEIPTRGQIAVSDEDLMKIHREMEKEARKYLDRIARRLEKSKVKVSCLVTVGNPAQSLIEYTHNNRVDLLIMASHGRSGIAKLFWGSVTEKVIRAVDVPVLLVKRSSCNERS